MILCLSARNYADNIFEKAMNIINLSREKLFRLLEEDKKALDSINRQIVSYVEEYEASRNEIQRVTLRALITQQGESKKAYSERRAAHARRCLLPEILANVFRSAILDLEAPMDPPGSHAYDLSQEILPCDIPPMNISQVCRDWRNIAMSLPVVWSFICIQPDSLRGLIRASSRLKTWLGKSMSHPLSLRVNLNISGLSRADGDERDGIIQVSSTILRQLILQSHRWRKAEMACDLSIAGPLTLANNSILTDLAFCISKSEHGAAVAPTAAIDFFSIPKLQTLSLIGCISLLKIPEAANLSDLTSLNLQPGLGLTIVTGEPTELKRFPTGSDCLNIFRSAPFLKEARIALGGDDSVAILREVSPASLEYLVFMDFSYNEVRMTTSMLHLLRNISAPSLELLILNISSPRYPEGANFIQQRDIFMELADFVSRSNMTLSTLVVRHLSFQFQIEVLQEVLQRLPELLHLHIQSPTFTPAFLQSLAQKANSDEFSLCPHLNTLYFEENDEYAAQTLFNVPNQGFGEETLSSILDVISSRWNVAPEERSFRSVVINSAVARSKEMAGWDPVKALVSEGLRFRLAPRT